MHGREAFLAGATLALSAVVALTTIYLQEFGGSQLQGIATVSGLFASPADAVPAGVGSPVE